MRQAGDSRDGEPLSQGALNELFFFSADAIGAGLGCEGLVALSAAQPLGTAPVLSPVDDGLGLLAVRAGLDGVIHASDSTLLSTHQKR